MASSAFGHAYLKDTVFVGGFDAILPRDLRQREGTPELCGDPFYVAVFNALSRRFGFAFPTVFDRYENPFAKELLTYVGREQERVQKARRPKLT